MAPLYGQRESQQFKQSDAATSAFAGPPMSEIAKRHGFRLVDGSSASNGTVCIPCKGHTGAAIGDQREAAVQPPRLAVWPIACTFAVNTSRDTPLCR